MGWPRCKPGFEFVIRIFSFFYLFGLINHPNGFLTQHLNMAGGSAFNSKYAPAGVKKKTYKKKQPARFVAGRDRQVGLYGRFPPTGGELKYQDDSFNLTLVPATGSVLDSILAIAEGTAPYERVGRKITLRSFHIRYDALLPPSSVATAGTPNQADSLRVIVFLDKQCNGAVAAVTDLLAVTNIRSYRNITNTNRFRVLYDEVTDLNPQNMTFRSTDTLSSAVNVSKIVNLKMNIPVEYSSITGVTSGIRSNNIGILVITRNDKATFKAQYRVRYSDF